MTRITKSGLTKSGLTASAVACLALLVSAVLPAQKASKPRVAPSSKAPSGEVLEWTSSEGKPYWYRMPKKKRPGRKPNLILMLHGTGGKWYWAFANYPIASGQFRPHDIVVAPEGMTPGQGDTFNFVQGKKDGDHIASLVQQFRKQCDIDRVYLYGHSQGAFFCYWFAGEYPHIVDGIVAHAGNVLSVKHPKLAVENVGIGILHGKADAVVPVDCAYRTERIYRKKGYKKLKLYIVEGLTARSGHWPLPFQVGEMLDWLDKVTAASPASALEAGFAELLSKKPDVGTMADSVARAKQLLKKTKGSPGDVFEQRLDLLQVVLGECATAHASALAAMTQLNDKKAGYGPWAAQARVALGAFGSDSDFKKAMRKALTRAKAHGKQAARALKAIGNPSRKAFSTGSKAVQGAVLAESYETLASALKGLIDSPPPGTKATTVADLRTVLEGRAAHDAAGVAAAQKVTAGVVERYRDQIDKLRGDG